MLILVLLIELQKLFIFSIGEVFICPEYQILVFFFKLSYKLLKEEYGGSTQRQII